MDWQQEPQTNTVSQMHDRLRSFRLAVSEIPPAGVTPESSELAFWIFGRAAPKQCNVV